MDLMDIIDTRANATLHLEDGREDLLVSSSYEYVEGSADSPYIITSSSVEAIAGKPVVS